MRAGSSRTNRELIGGMFVRGNDLLLAVVSGMVSEPVITIRKHA